MKTLGDVCLEKEGGWFICIVQRTLYEMYFEHKDGQLLEKSMVGQDYPRICLLPAFR